MPAYHSNDDESIRQVFDMDHESLARAGFNLPPDVRVFADDARPRSESTIGALGFSGLNDPQIKTDEFVVESELMNERAYE